MTITNKEIERYIADNIGAFHKARIESLKSLKIEKLLKRKNPYLFKCKNILNANELVEIILDAHLSSQEETMFGDFLEGLAIFINNKVFGGEKSGIKGIDLEFNKNNVKYIVSIKSGNNWGNSSQIEKMRADFKKAKISLRTSGGNKNLNIVAINGCCYGQDNKADKGDYFKYCGQEFWEFISNEKDLYITIIEPLGYKAKEKNDEFNKEYAKVINSLVKGFLSDFCNENGEINWERLVKYNSEKMTDNYFAKYNK
ncbi:MAG: cytosolic protein [Elusimicrobiota bacterium]|jgi:hypothetical protein|nr:cytosolic protein [Elusimicrobiota bacterium]